MLPIVGLVVAVATAVSIGLGMIAHRAVLRAETQAAADAAALAGVVEGRVGAADLADRNGAGLVRFVAVGTTVEVEVRRGGVRAVAAAAPGSNGLSTGPNQTSG
ncbi:MAG: hypothetical protein AAGA59_01260 [Actinomycetota bacterium]